MIDRLQEKDIDQVAQIEAEIFSVPWSIKSFRMRSHRSKIFI